MTRSRPTNASDGSRTDAHGGNSRGELVEAVEAAQREYDAAAGRVRAAETRLGELADRVRGRSPSESHRQLVAAAKRERVDAQAEAAELKTRLNALRLDLRNAEREGGRSAQLDRQAELLRDILAELRAIHRTMTTEDNE